MGRPPKVGGLRTTRSAEDDNEPSVLPDKKSGLYQFRSRAASFRFSVRRRRIERGPDNEAVEVSPRTKDEFDVPLDWVLFENNYFETASKEQAEAMVEKAKSLRCYGVGLELWSLEDEREKHDEAYERELRAQIAARPDIAARVLKPSDSEDFVLPSPPA